MGGHDDSERRRTLRYAATIRLAFQYAGRRVVGITTDVSVHNATLVAPVRLPPGAMVVFDVLDGEVPGSLGANNAEPVRLIASVVWSGPAPFGGSNAYAAGLKLVRVTGPTWERLIQFAKGTLHATRPSDVKRGGGTRPAFDLREDPVASGPQRPEVLYSVDGSWFRGELVSANPRTVWVATPLDPPRLHSPVRLNVGVRVGESRVPLVVLGKVPSSPLPDYRSKAWVFECEVESVSRQDLYDGLLAFIAPRGDASR